MPKTESTTEFLGVYMTDDQKDALVKEAERRGMTVSALTREMVKHLMVSLGYTLNED